jgi:hypothetical protein
MNTATKKLVKERVRNCCEYCFAQAKFSADNFVIEHILAVVLGGTDDPDNLALSCQCCNNFKYTAISALDPLSNTLASLYNPRIDTWHEHFVWSDNKLEIIGISPTGRATVYRLRLNRKGLLNLRRVLKNEGEHPPL